MEKEYVVGVDIGGQSAKIGLVNRRGEIIARKTMDTTKYGSNDENPFMNDLCETIQTMVQGAKTKDGSPILWGSINGVGIGAPNGNYKGIIEDAANLPWAKGKTIKLAEYLSMRMDGINVMVDNDANNAAVGEMMYGNAIGMKEFIEITLGTGVGSGIIIDGKLVHGADGFAGELGHVCAVRHNGRQCNCGKTGCLEAYTSAIGVARTAREWLDIDQSIDTPLRSLEVITSKDVGEAAKAGDLFSKRVLEFTGEMLGTMFADFVSFSAPEAIILFGGLAKSWEFIADPIRRAMEPNLLSYWKDKIKILPSGLPDSDAAILGASALAW